MSENDRKPPTPDDRDPNSLAQVQKKVERDSAELQAELDLLFPEISGSAPIPIRYTSGGPGIGDDELNTPSSHAHPHDAAASHEIPTRLGHLNHYLICDPKDIVARWNDDGKGWMIKLKDGFVRAGIVPTSFATIGTFVLIEIGFEHREDGLHLTHVASFHLAEYYALAKLTKSDNAILSAITGRAELNHRQRSFVRELVAANFLPHVGKALDELLP